MVSKAMVFNLLLTFASIQLGSAARVAKKRSADSLNSNSTDESYGGSVCSITEMEGHIKYGVTFNFQQKKCNRVSCNVFDFLAETVIKMIKAEPKYKGQEDMCGCHVKDGPSQGSPVQQFLFKFDQFKNPKTKTYIYDCTPKMCWSRYSQIVALAKRTERGSIDWPRTQDFESRNHYKADCVESTESTVSELAASSLPTVHKIVKDLKKAGKEVNEILQIVEDEPDNDQGDEAISPGSDTSKKFPIFLTEVDDGSDAHLHNIAFVDKYTDLKDIVVLSNSQGICSANAIDYTSYSSADVKCGLIKTSEDCELAAQLLKRSVGGKNLEMSDVFNDMSHTAEEKTQALAIELKKKQLMRYPPACFGRITGQGGPLHMHWSPLAPPERKESPAKASKGSVMNRLICGCYGEAEEHSYL